MNGFALFPSHLLYSASLNSEIMRRIEYKEGEKVGSCIFIKETEPKIRSSGFQRRRALFECDCGNVFESEISKVKTGSTKSCGCYNVLRIKETSITHGLSKTPLYFIWKAIKQRCENKHNSQYYNYGGRGITVCKEWRDDFSAFYKYVASLDAPNTKERLTIDRINNNGNYEPGNIRLATYKIQANNRRRRKDARL